MTKRALEDGKKSDMTGEITWVVAGALAGPDGVWLMHQRSLKKAHGGLWEFPGGKIESAEIPVEALIRELHEELGIVVEAAHCSPAGFAEERRIAGKNPIVILLYTIADWVGSPKALEGEAVAWFAPEEIADLPKPPLDEQLAGQLFGQAGEKRN